MLETKLIFINRKQHNSSESVLHFYCTNLLYSPVGVSTGAGLSSTREVIEGER